MKRKLRKITKANITHISFVPKGANGQDFLIVKAADGAPDLVHESPILKVDEDKHLVTGVVYAPDVVDSQGEYMEAPAIEKAAHDFMASSRKMDERHNFVSNDSVSVVESYVAKADTEVDGQPIKKGTWLITAKVNDDNLWAAVKKGEYRGFSMGGTGTREEVEVEETAVKKDEQGLFTILKDFFSAGKVPARQEETGAVEKAGKSFSAANAGKIKAAYESLGELITQMEIGSTEPESEGNVKKEELQAVIKEAVQPIAERLDKLEKGEQQTESTAETTLTKEDVSAVIKEALQPVTDRLEKVEKTRGISKQMEDDAIEKQADRPFASIDI